MKKIFVLLSVVMMMIAIPLSAAPKFKIRQLQGAWWSNFKNPTADFRIQGNQVWLDYDSAYHPCRIEGDILIFELGSELGLQKNRIVSIKGNHLKLEHLDTKKEWSLIRTAK